MSLLDWLRTPPPDVAVEIDRAHVGAVRLERRGGRLVVAAYAVEALPAGAVAPALVGMNMPDVGAVGQAVARVLSQLGGRTHRVALVVPDTVAKVSLLRLEKVPASTADLREIVRWQVRKSAPFPLEQAVLSIGPGAPGGDGGREFIVARARADGIRQYEQACTMAGAHAGIVDLATFGVLNGVVAGGGAPLGSGPSAGSGQDPSAGSGQDWLLVHVAGTCITLAVVRGEHVIFFRHRSDESEGTLADLIHQTAMYYEDRLNGAGIARVWLAGMGSLPDADRVARDLEARLGAAVDRVDPRTAVALVDRIDSSPELDDLLAPLVGVLRRERRAA
jgi:Tfp pilus assembly PilM family ATPase